MTPQKNNRRAHLPVRLSNVLPLSFVAIVAFAVILTGCDVFGSSEPATGRVIVHLTDAPLDEFAEVNVTISRVELIGADGTDGHVLSDEEQVFDLLTLQNGITAQLADQEIPEGTYAQLRLIVADEADVLLNGGSRVLIPSGQQTGIKVTFPAFTIAEGDLVELTADFEVNESFVKAGQADFYIFTPVIKAHAMVVNGEELPVE